MASRSPAAGSDVARHAAVIIAGHRGELPVVEQAKHDPSPLVRLAALGALARMGRLDSDDLEAAFSDDDRSVRARAAELAAHRGDLDLTSLLADVDERVVEVACFAAGERDWSAADHPAPITELSAIARSHDSPLCRESAAAALGAIGDPAGLDAVLDACTDRVTVRRRAVLALAAFDDDRAEAALRAALDDKDWQVRQGAEDLLEVGRVLDAPPDPDAYADDGPDTRDRDPD